MSLGFVGWMMIERLAWSSLALVLSVCAASFTVRQSVVSPSAKAWIWRLALLQALVVLFFNAGVGIEMLHGSSGAAGSSAPGWAAAGAGLAAFWLLPAMGHLTLLARAAWATRRMLAELPSMPKPMHGSPGTASYRLMRELSCPVVALCPGPVIAAPDWCWKDTAQARLALAHESAHIKRGDVVWQVLASIAASLFWFHPLAKTALRELSFWQECAADAAAMKMIDCQNDDYADAILGIVAGARQPDVPLALGLGMQARQLGRRLEVAVDGDRARPWLGAMLAIALVAPALVPWRVIPKPSAVSGRAEVLSPPISRPDAARIAAPVSPISAPMSAAGG